MKNGTIVAKDSGKAILTIETSDGEKKKVEVEVKKNLDSNGELIETTDSEFMNSKENNKSKIIIIVLIGIFIIILATIIYNKKIKKIS